MNIVRSYIIFEKFSENETDPITDMGIGAIHRFKDIFNLFGEIEDKKYIYTVVVFGNFLDFWFNHPVIIKLSETKLNSLFDYVKTKIDNLGFSNILINPEFYKCYYTKHEKILPRIVRYEIIPQIQRTFKDGEYRRRDHHKYFEYYYSLDNNYNRKSITDIAE